MTEVAIEFEEICPRNKHGKPITGIMLSGTAWLESSNDEGFGEPHEFYVDTILVEGGNPINLQHARAHPGSFDAVIFKAVADEIENSKTEKGRYASAMFSEAVEAEREAA